MKHTILCFFLGLISIGCTRQECLNSSPILASESPDKDSYQEELIRLLMEHPAQDYFFESYRADKDGGILGVRIIGDSLCATGEFRIIEHSGKLDKIVQTKGVGYSGAELAGFRFSISQDYGLVFEDVDSIVD